MNKKRIPRGGYRVLAIVWTLAAASMAVAVVRRLPGLSVPSLCLLAVSILAAMSFWSSYKRIPLEGGTNNDSEEKKHE